MIERARDLQRTLPGGQETQNDDPWSKCRGVAFVVLKYFPGVQPLSLVGLGVLGILCAAWHPVAGQSVQRVAPGKLVCPLGHALQAIDFKPGWKRPAGHRAQTDLWFDAAL